MLATYDFVTSRLKLPTDKLSEEERQRLGVNVRSSASKQQHAFDEINRTFEEKNVCLLHGVTSSGKTEVYMALIEQVLAAGKQVSLFGSGNCIDYATYNWVGCVFGEQMGVYHSRFPDNERVVTETTADEDALPLILGVRSSIFLPFQNLGLVIVDEEHETNDKQQDPAPSKKS